MFTDTANIRLWIYRSTVALNPGQEKDIALMCQQFIDQWASHGKKLDAEFRILEGHFIVFFVDESSASASGCSIDSSVALIRQVEDRYRLGLFDRMQVPFNIDGEIVMHHFQDLPQLYKEGLINDDSRVYNLLLQDGRNFEGQWLIPFSASPYYSSVS